MTTRNKNNGRDTLITPENSALLLIDHQSQMLFGVQSHDRTLIINNVVGLAKAARVFDVPTVLSTVAARTFSGPLFPELQAVFPQSRPIDRTSMNAWEDKNFLAAASGGVSVEAHQLAVQQMLQAGARPRTWQQVMYEWQRDWARLETADPVREIIRKHGGAFAQGIVYAKAMFGGEEGRPLQAPRRGIRPVEIEK